MKTKILLFLMFAITQIGISQKLSDSMTTIILVRHAEKAADGTNNPTLSKAGLLRSIQLAYMLREDSIAAVFSTDYERTIKTAEPTANFHDLPVKKYMANNQVAFLENILAQYQGKTVLIVGHSNTVPDMLNWLTDKPYWKIEDYVYNDFFVVNVSQQGDGKVLHLKYGAMSEPPMIYNVDENNVGVQGYDVVAYFLENKAVEGNRYISTTYEGVTYYFSSQKYLTIFTENPQKYAPQYGGWCAYGMVNGENDQVGKYPINPFSFKIISGQLYLFGKTKTYNGLELWEQENDYKNLKKANMTWEMLKK